MGKKIGFIGIEIYFGFSLIFVFIKIVRSERIILRGGRWYYRV